MKYYRVGITILNSFEIEAESAESAETKVREMSDAKILCDSDFSVAYKDEITDEKELAILRS